MALLTGRFRKGEDEEPPAAYPARPAPTVGISGRQQLPEQPTPPEDTGGGGLFGEGGLAGRQQERRQQEASTGEVASDDPAKEAARNAAQQAANAGARLFAQTQVATDAANQQGGPEVVRSGGEATAPGKRRGRFRAGGNSSTIRI